MKKTLKINKNKKKYKNTTKIGGHPSSWLSNMATRARDAVSPMATRAQKAVSPITSAVGSTATRVSSAVGSTPSGLQKAYNAYGENSAQRSQEAENEKKLIANIKDNKTIALLIRYADLKTEEPDEPEDPEDLDKKGEQIRNILLSPVKKDTWYDKQIVTTAITGIENDIGFITSNNTEMEKSMFPMSPFAKKVSYVTTESGKRVAKDLPLICGSISGKKGTWRQLKRNMMVLANTNTDKLMKILLDDNGMMGYSQLVKDVSYLKVGVYDDIEICNKQLLESMFKYLYEQNKSPELVGYIQQKKTDFMDDTDFPGIPQDTVELLNTYLQYLQFIRIKKSESKYYINAQYTIYIDICFQKILFPKEDLIPKKEKEPEEKEKEKEALNNVIFNLFKYNKSLLGVLVNEGRDVSKIFNDLDGAFLELSQDGKLDIETIKKTNEAIYKNKINYLILLNKILIDTLKTNEKIFISDTVLKGSVQPQLVDDTFATPVGAAPGGDDEEAAPGGDDEEEEEVAAAEAAAAAAEGPRAEEAREDIDLYDSEVGKELYEKGGGIVKRGTRKRRKRNKNKSRKNINSK